MQGKKVWELSINYVPIKLLLERKNIIYSSMLMQKNGPLICCIYLS